MTIQQRRRTSLAAAVISVATLATAFAAGGTHAGNNAFPGKNGRIVFNDQNGYLVLVNPDGTGLVRLARTRAADYAIGSSFSPDGRLIAYSQSGNDADIFVVRPDGSGQREITFSRGQDVDPTWSSDGRRIAFETDRNGNVDFYSAAAVGSGSQQLTSSPENERDP